MRISPIAQTLLLLVCLGLLLIPLAKLTRKGEVNSSQERRPSTEIPDVPVPSEMSLRFAHAPDHIEIKIDGRLLWAVATDGSTEYANRFDLPFSEGALEIELHVQWSDSTPNTVAEVKVTPDGYDAVRYTTWGEGTLTDYPVFKIR